MHWMFFSFISRRLPRNRVHRWRGESHLTLVCHSTQHLIQLLKCFEGYGGEYASLPCKVIAMHTNGRILEILRCISRQVLLLLLLPLLTHVVLGSSCCQICHHSCLFKNGAFLKSLSVRHNSRACFLSILYNAFHLKAHERSRIAKNWEY